MWVLQQICVEFVKHKLCFEFIFPFFDFEVMNSGDDDEDEYSTRSANKLQPQMVGFLFSEVWTTLICRPLNLTHKQIYFPTNRPFIANSSLTHRSMDQRVQILTKWSGKPQVEFTLRNIDLFTSFHHHHHCQQTNRQFTRRHRCCSQLLFRCLARLVPVNRPRGRWLYYVS